MAPTAVTQRAEVAYRAGLSALAGFIDVSVCSLLISRLGWATSFAWAVVAAALSALGYVVLHAFTRTRAGSCATNAAEQGDGLSDRLDRLAHEIEHLPDDNPDPWFVRWFWNVVIALGWLAFSLATLLLGYPRTVMTVAIFGLMTSDVWMWSVVGALAVSIGIQFAVVAGLIEPRARRQGIEL